jgi:microcystin-dependent protein
MSDFKISSDYVLDQNGYTQSYPVGSVIISMSSTIPEGWLLCDGRPVSQNDYPELYSILGGFYGYSSPNFNLPPLVVNATHNPYPRSAVSLKSTEPSYPNVFGHSHNVAMTGHSFAGHNYAHAHNTNSAGTNGDTHYHAHNASGNSSGSSNSGGSSNQRLAGPLGPYASGPGGGTGHSHNGAGWSAVTDAGGFGHAHTANFHSSNLQTNHSHNTNMTSSTFSVSDAAIATPGTTQYPLSKQVYFLIKH